MTTLDGLPGMVPPPNSPVEGLPGLPGGMVAVVSVGGGGGGGSVEELDVEELIWVDLTSSTTCANFSFAFGRRRRTGEGSDRRSRFWGFRFSRQAVAN